MRINDSNNVVNPNSSALASIDDNIIRKKVKNLLKSCNI